MITLVCWALVALTWLLGAVRTAVGAPAVRAREGRDRASLAAAAAGVAVLESPARIWHALVLDAPAARAAGAVVLGAATVAALWTRARLGAAWSSAALVREGARLRTSGPYAVTRHPTYSAVTAMVAGTALTQGLGRWVAVLALVALALRVKAAAEERLLARAFGAEYARYRRRVPGLVPRPWRMMSR